MKIKMEPTSTRGQAPSPAALGAVGRGCYRPYRFGGRRSSILAPDLIAERL